MFCRKCGTENDDNAYKCVRCQTILQEAEVERIDNSLVLAILVTVLCCLPFGVVGIVYSAQVNAKAQAGDIAGARESARKAKLWSYWGLGLGVLMYSIYVIVAVMGAAANM